MLFSTMAGQPRGGSPSSLRPSPGALRQAGSQSTPGYRSSLISVAEGGQRTLSNSRSSQKLTPAPTPMRRHGSSTQAGASFEAISDMLGGVTPTTAQAMDPFRARPASADPSPMATRGSAHRQHLQERYDVHRQLAHAQRDIEPSQISLQERLISARLDSAQTNSFNRNNERREAERLLGSLQHRRTAHRRHPAPQQSARADQAAHAAFGNGWVMQGWDEGTNSKPRWASMLESHEDHLRGGPGCVRRSPGSYSHAQKAAIKSPQALTQYLKNDDFPTVSPFDERGSASSIRGSLPRWVTQERQPSSPLSRRKSSFETMIAAAAKTDALNWNIAVGVPSSGDEEPRFHIDGAPASTSASTEPPMAHTAAQPRSSELSATLPAPAREDATVPVMHGEALREALAANEGYPHADINADAAGGSTTCIADQLAVPPAGGSSGDAAIDEIDRLLAVTAPSANLMHPSAADPLVDPLVVVEPPPMIEPAREVLQKSGFKVVNILPDPPLADLTQGLMVDTPEDSPAEPAAAEPGPISTVLDGEKSLMEILEDPDYFSVRGPCFTRAGSHCPHVTHSAALPYLTLPYLTLPYLTQCSHCPHVTHSAPLCPKFILRPLSVHSPLTLHSVHSG